jgi:CheY-like chemotaxis protein
MILILEDDADRIARFHAVLQQLDPSLEIRLWRNAWKMIRESEPVLPRVCLISLDHDLDPEEDGDDPGTGYEVAQFLASHAPTCPVIIHTSNGERGTWMQGAFDLEGWETHRVGPWGDDWIERSWRRTVRRLLSRRR